MKLEKILEICTREMGFYAEAGKTDIRLRYLVYTRNLYFKFAREFTKYSTTQIGMVVKKDHATVLHGLKTIENIIQQDDYIRDVAEKIETEIKDFSIKEYSNKIDIFLVKIKEISNIITELQENFVILRGEVLDINKTIKN